jgi:hypothetical protein
LVFKIGTFDDAVQAALQFSATRTVAFALRTSYDEATGRSTGYVWLAPDRGEKRYQGPMLASEFWARKNVMRNVLMHEVGHVFGLEHYGQTVMDERLPARVVAKGLDVALTAPEISDGQALLRPFCGRVVGADDAALKLWDLTAEGLQLCLSPRQDLIGTDSDTPTLLEIKRGEQVLVSQRISTQGWYPDGEIAIRGSYLEKKGSEPVAYKHVEFVFQDRAGRLRGSFPAADGALRFVEIEQVSPGVAAVRFAIDATWPAITAVTAAGPDQILALTKLLGEDD